MSLKKYKSQGKAVEVTVNSKEEKSYAFCLDFVLEIGLRINFKWTPTNNTGLICGILGF